MQKDCKKCKYRLQYKVYCKDQELKKQMQKDKLEILNEIKKNKIDYSDEPSEDMVKYCKSVKQKIENTDNTYRKILKFIYGIVLVGCIFMIITPIYFAIKDKQWNFLVVPIPFSIFLVAFFILRCEVKEKTDQDAFNSLMALISLTSLVLAILSMFG